MTDAAIADSGPAPVEGAPITEQPGFSAPLGSQAPEPRPAEPAKPASLDDVLDNAIAKTEAKQAAVDKPPAKVDGKTPDAKVAAPVKEPQPKGPDGKFAARELADAGKTAEPAKPSFTASEAPSRFSEDAKKEWAAAPESVRRETERMQKELTDGFQKYKAAAERDTQLNEFHEMAKASGKDLRSVVGEYVNMETMLRKDLVGGLDQICQKMGVSIRDVAAHVMGQKPEQVSSQQDATIRELKQQITQLSRQVGGVTQTIEQQREHATLNEISKFASAPENARFEELADDIAFLMRSGRAKDLPEAYKLADRLNPAPGKASDSAASSAAMQDPPVHPDKGQKSINGAPSSGLTSPAPKKRSTRSLDEALDRAFGAAG